GALVDFVLGGAGQRDVARNRPDAGAPFVVDRVRMLADVFLDPLALHFLEPLHRVQLDAFRIVHVAVGIAAGDHLGAELLGFLDGVDGHVAGTGHDDRLAGEGVVLRLQHFVDEVDAAVARRFRAAEAAEAGDALARQDARFVAAADALVLAEHVADFAAAHADVPGGHVNVRADAPVQVGHEALREAHDFLFRLALRIEIGAALAAADRLAGQGVFENLLEAQKLDDAGVHRRMEADAALVRAEGAVVLHAEAAVDVDVALVVGP